MSFHFMSFHIISCHFMTFMSFYVVHNIHVIDVIQCHLMLFELFMSFPVISCHFMSFHVISCHFMSFMSFHFMSIHVISCHFRSFNVSLDFSDQLSVKSGEGQGRGSDKYVFLGLRRQLRCQAKGKNTITMGFTI
jgi:hypothetical protein